MGKPNVTLGRTLAILLPVLLPLLLPALLAGCGPRARVPLRPIAPIADSADLALARAVAPLLYLQPDETFRLARVVAVIHPNRRIVGYHLLWEDDAHGAWLPFTIATDEELVWVGVGDDGRPTDLWTYWHGVVLHAPWRGRGRPEVDVQWGKHGSLPRGTPPGDLPFPRTHRFFYALAWVLPDLWLGAFERPGPLCFCGSYERYLTFSEPLAVAHRIDAVLRTDDPRVPIRAVFGERYSEKPPWP